jgi:ATP-dependent Clp protease ATP-binding subunit ClpC
VKILLGLREKYETYHKCKFTLEAINAAVYLSARYIPDRQLPDKAIDLIDEAGSRARMESFNKKKEGQSSVLSRSPDEYWQEIKAAQAMHEVVMGHFYCLYDSINLINIAIKASNIYFPIYYSGVI